MSEGGYRDWSSLAQAIKEAAKRAVASGRARDVNAAIVQARFDRFLSRVFVSGEGSGWLLKGGTSILARVPLSRATRDVDLAAVGADGLDEAVAALEQVVGADHGDHVRFELISSRATGLGENQPGVRTRRLVFSCLDAATGRRLGEVPVDVVVGPAPVGRPQLVEPANRLQLGRPVPAVPYLLFPVSDQIAEKVCATMATDYPGGRVSSRVKDLVDLVVLARTQQVDLDELRRAIAAKADLSGLGVLERFAVPAGWERPYRALSSKAAAAADVDDLSSAVQLVGELVDRALAARPGDPAQVWIPGSGWEDAASPTAARAAGDAVTSGGAEVVRAHTRSGVPVRTYQRAPRGQA